MRSRTLPLLSFAAFLLAFCALGFASFPAAHAQVQADAAQERLLLHQNPDWLAVAEHLPDPKTADAADLEMAADVLHARRFPEDALDYYAYAIKRGAPLARVMNKMGVVDLELRQLPLAHEVFRQLTKAKKKDATAWNNLGATEYMQKQYRAAMTDYRRAAKLDPASATYHCNLGMAYFETGDMQSARQEFAVALRLDPHAFDHHQTGGISAQIVGTQNYGQLAFEMAKVFARSHDDESTVLWLAKATEAGYDTKRAILDDAVLKLYAQDPRVIMMLKNAEEMKMRAVAVAAPAGLGPAAAQEMHRD